MVNYNVRIDNAKIINTLMDNLCTCTKEQIAELIKKQLKRSHASVSFDEALLLRIINREKRKGMYRTEDFLNGKDFIISPYGEAGNLAIIPCFWVLQDMFKDEYISLTDVFRGKNPETMSYSTENITYSFYYMTEDTLGIMPKSIERAKVYASINEKTRNGKYHLINVYVTDSIEIADTLSEATKDIPCQIAVIKTDKSPYEKPTQIAYIANGKRVK